MRRWTLSVAWSVGRYKNKYNKSPNSKLFCLNKEPSTTYDKKTELYNIHKEGKKMFTSNKQTF